MTRSFFFYSHTGRPPGTSNCKSLATQLTLPEQSQVNCTHSYIQGKVVHVTVTACTYTILSTMCIHTNDCLTFQQGPQGWFYSQSHREGQRNKQPIIGIHSHKCSWALTRDTMAHTLEPSLHPSRIAYKPRLYILENHYLPTDLLVWRWPWIWHVIYCWYHSSWSMLSL